MAHPTISYQSGCAVGNFTLTGKAYRLNSRLFVEAICSCGCVRFEMYNRILQGETVSCGCKRKPHGLSKKHPIYSTWNNMKSRCYIKTASGYDDYGGKGIIVCDEWLKNFSSFYEWSIKNGWAEGLSLDRFPNKAGNYQPENCRWATDEMQNRNRVDNIFLTAFGETKCLQDWLKDVRCTIKSHYGLRQRIKRGWDSEKVISFKNRKMAA